MLLKKGTAEFFCVKVSEEVQLFYLLSHILNRIDVLSDSSFDFFRYLVGEFPKDVSKRTVFSLYE